MPKSKIFFRPPNTKNLSNYISAPISVSPAHEEPPEHVLQRILNAAINYGFNPAHDVYITPPRTDSSHRIFHSTVYQYYKHTKSKLRLQFLKAKLNKPTTDKSNLKLC